MNKTPPKQLLKNKSKSKSPSSSSSKRQEPSSSLSSPSSSSSFNLIRINSIENTPHSIEHISILNDYSLLALCRSDNSIEIWCSDTWIQLIKIPGYSSIQTRRVYLYKTKNETNSNNIIHKVKLFTSGLNGYFIEWNLLSMQPKYSYNIPNNSIWDMSLQNKVFLLAANDGVIRAIKIKSKASPYLLKQFSKCDDSRVLAICWENTTHHKTKSKTRVFYSGHSNGTVRKWNFETNQILLTLTNPSTVDKNILIWSLCSINSKYLLCGTSNGSLLVYDINFGVLVKEFKEHVGDILTITCNNQCSNSNSSNSNNVIAYYSGVDSLICSVTLDNKNNEWVLTSSFRGQSHDVNVLALLNEEFLLSGGITTDICVNKLHGGNLYMKYDKKVNTSIKRHISAFEQRKTYFHTSFINNGTNMLILHKKQTQCDLYSMNIVNNTMIYLAKIMKHNKYQSNVIACGISDKGNYICISYENVTVVFKYTYNDNTIKKIASLKHQSKFIFFNKNEDKLYLISQKEQSVYVISLLPNTVNEDNAISFANNSKGIVIACDYNDNNAQIVVSTSSCELYLINCNNNNNDKRVVSLPHPTTYITQVKFNTFNTNNTLIAVDSNNLIYIIDTQLNKFTPWTVDRIDKSDYPSNYLKWYNKVYGIVPLNQSTFILYTDYNYIKVDTSKQIPHESVIEKHKMDKYINSDWDKIVKEYHQYVFDCEYKGSVFTKMKNDLFKLEGSTNSNNNVNATQMIMNDNFKIVSRFNSIMLMELVGDGLLLVIENDWNKIVKSFVGGVVRANYGH